MAALTCSSTNRLEASFAANNVPAPRPPSAYAHGTSACKLGEDSDCGIDRRTVFGQVARLANAESEDRDRSDPADSHDMLAAVLAARPCVSSPWSTNAGRVGSSVSERCLG